MSIALPTTEYSYFRGRVSVFERDATTGATGAGIYVGNVPELKLGITKESIDHYESMSGLNRLDRRIQKTLGVEITMTLENIAKEVAELLVWSERQTIAAQSNHLYTFPTGIADGELHLIDGVSISNVDSFVDSTGSPITLVEGTDYTIDLNMGVVKFLDVSGLVQPFKLTYDSNAVTAVPVASVDQPVRFIRFEGTNKGNPGQTQRRIFEFYYCPLEPVGELGLLGDDLGKFELKASCLVDDTREDDAELGAFGRILYL
jgi:hypothetical protein